MYSGYRADDGGEKSDSLANRGQVTQPCGLVQGHNTCAVGEDARFLFVGLVSAVTEWGMTASTNQGEG